MHDLQQFFSAKQPAIEKALREHIKNLDPTVKPVIEHVIDAGGKRLRPMLALLTTKALGGAADDAMNMACSLELLHSATLLHDDIMDGSDLRRGRKAAHLEFGTTPTIMAGDVLLALGNRLMAEYDIPRLTKAVSDAILYTAVGQVSELAAQCNPKLGREEYIKIITGKTAYFIQAACRCGAVLCNAGDELEGAAAGFGLDIGIAFQLVDDALDYSSTKEQAGKPVGADLKEGKPTLPLLLYLDELSTSEYKDFCKKFEDGAFSDEEVLSLVHSVREGGYEARTREIAGEYLTSAEERLSKFPESRERELLRQALVYVKNREK